MNGGHGENNLMDEFEEAFQTCILSITKLEPSYGSGKEEIELEVQKASNRFIDVARQMEAFFLQKRFLFSAMKPETLIKDENTDLKSEIQRKDLLLNNHYNRLEEWKACLSDMQQGGHSRTQPPTSEMASGSGMNVGPNRGPPGGLNMQGGSGMIGPVGQMSSGPGVPQQHMQMQQQKMLQMRIMNKIPK